MTTMQINGSDTGTLRLFSLDLPPEAVERFVTQAGTGEWPMKYAFGAKALKASFVDVIDIRDLGDMSLSQYLVDAHGVSGADFKAMRPQIDALRGHVIAVPAQAFDKTSQALTIATPLRWVGTFDEEKAMPRGPKLRAASAKGIGALSGQSSAGRGASMLLKLILLGVGIVVLLLLTTLFR